MANRVITLKDLDELKHYGVLGMKWGVRRTPEQLGHKPKGSKESDQKEVSVNSLEGYLIGIGVSLLLAGGRYVASNVGNKSVMTKANEPDLQLTSLKQASKISPPESYMDSARNTNNTRSINKNFNNNCPNTTMAYELRRRGYDVKAKPAPSGMLLRDIMQDYGNPPRYDFTRLHRSLSYKKLNEVLNDHLESLPNGYRGAASVTWRSVNSGHIFNIEKIDGKIMFIDSQSGKFGEYKGLNAPKVIKESIARNTNPFHNTRPENYLTRADSLSLFRLDDAKINEKNISDKILRG